MDSLNEMVGCMQIFFGIYADELARNTKLVQRNSPLNGSFLLIVLVFGYLKNPQATYNDLACFSARLGKAVTRGAIFQRFNKQLLSFLEQLTSYALTNFTQKIGLPLKLFSNFSAVKIIDSTGVPLCPKLKDIYPGCGGDGPKASLKLQITWDYLRAQITNLDITVGSANDQSYHNFIDHLPVNSLILFDLGYCTIINLKELINKGIYFLSRQNLQTNLYQKTGERFNFLEYLRQTAASAVDMELELGEKERLLVRIVALRLPDDVCEKRLQQLFAKSRKKGKAITQHSLDYIHWQIFTTNVPVEWLNAEQIGLVYRLRWQIELLFKALKSVAGFKKLGTKTAQRVKCEIYAKMLGIILYTYLVCVPEELAIFETEDEVKEISAFKSLRILKDDMEGLALALSRKEKQNISEIIKTMRKLVAKYGYKEKQPSRPSSYQQLANPSEKEAQINERKAS